MTPLQWASGVHGVSEEPDQLDHEDLEELKNAMAMTPAPSSPNSVRPVASGIPLLGSVCQPH